MTRCERVRRDSGGSFSLTGGSHDRQIPPGSLLELHSDYPLRRMMETALIPGTNKGGSVTLWTLEYDYGIAGCSVTTRLLGAADRIQYSRRPVSRLEFRRGYGDP